MPNCHPSRHLTITARAFFNDRLQLGLFVLQTVRMRATKLKTTAVMKFFISVFAVLATVWIACQGPDSMQVHFGEGENIQPYAISHSWEC